MKRCFLFALFCFGCGQGTQGGTAAQKPPTLWMTPDDLTSNHGGDVKLWLHFGNAGEATSQVAVLLQGARLIRMNDAASVPLVLETIHLRREGTDFPGVLLRPTSALAQGWYEVRVPDFTPYVLQANRWVWSLPLAHFGDGSYGTRFRVGSKLVVGNVKVCPAVDSTPAKIFVRFSEKAVLENGVRYVDAIRAYDASGSPVRTINDPASPLTTAFPQLLETGGKAAEWGLFVDGNPPETVRIEVTDAARSEHGQPLSATAGGASSPSGENSSVRFSNTLRWKDMPFFNDCHFWTPPP